MQLHFVKRVCLIVVLPIATFIIGPAPTLRAQTPELTKADVDRLMKELSNWGRWGKEDQLGTLNLITAKKRVQAAGLVKEGISVSLARNVEKKEAADNPQPFVHKMLATGKGE